MINFKHIGEAMKIILLLLTLFSSTFAQNWELVWSDEFNSDGAVDKTKWNFATYGNEFGWWNNEDQNYTDDSQGKAQQQHSEQRYN